MLISTDKKRLFYRLSILAVFLISLASRFWGLSRFNELVFDEVYTVDFALNYLDGSSFVMVHPPLSAYFVAVGIWLCNFNPLGFTVQSNLEGIELATFSYRWVNSLIGSFIPVAVILLVSQLSKQQKYVVLAGLLTAMDGYLIVESRYALSNIYLVFFGLIAQWLFLIAIEQRPKRRGMTLLASGLFLGMTIGVKWNGLGFLLGLYGIFIASRILQRLQSSQEGFLSLASTVKPESKADDLSHIYKPLLWKISQIKIQEIVFYLGVIPFISYYLVWIPHLLIYPDESFWGWHAQAMGYHQDVGSGPDEHPYCSKWYTWPFMLRPIGYFYRSLTDGGVETIYDVHGMGNPILWWLSAIAFFLALFFVLWQATNQSIAAFLRRPIAVPLTHHEFGVSLFLVINYLANFLPWAKVSRCLFAYHYLSALVFSFMLLGFGLNVAFEKRDPFLKLTVVFCFFAIIGGFLFWLPLFLGLPITPDGFRARMWFESWI